METNPESVASPEEGKALFEAYVAAEDQVQAILKEIDERLSQAEDRGQAERDLLITHAARVEEATQKARELLNEWLGCVRRMAREE
jgi:hypothetical protein